MKSRMKFVCDKCEARFKTETELMIHNESVRRMDLSRNAILRRIIINTEYS